ncbi:MAG: NADH-quinone oxidoreductase subunit NuoE [Lentisphaeria bacterium]|nr:NADH-quinone oxidoreductase subunit NuoE [Lentisphaeria bacterium]
MDQAKTAAEMAARMENAEQVLKANNYDKARLVPILQEVQARYGWLSQDLISYVARAVGLPPARVYGVATFYAHFTLKPKGKHVIKLCDGTACHVKGSTKLLTALRTRLGMAEGDDTSKDGMFTIDTVSCLGACGLAPVMVIDSEVHGQVKPDQVDAILDAVLENDKNEMK